MRINRVKIIAEMARQNIRCMELAEKAGVSYASITGVCNGKSVNENTAKHIAKALGVSIDDLKEEVKQ